MVTAHDILTRENKKREEAFSYDEKGGIVIHLLRFCVHHRRFQWCYKWVTEKWTIRLTEQLVARNWLSLRETNEEARAFRMLRYADDIYMLGWFLWLVLAYATAFAIVSTSVHPLAAVSFLAFVAASAIVMPLYCWWMARYDAFGLLYVIYVFSYIVVLLVIIQISNPMLIPHFLSTKLLFIQLDTAILVIITFIPLYRIMETLSVIAMLHTTKAYETDAPMRALVKTVLAYIEAALSFSIIYIVVSYTRDDTFADEGKERLLKAFINPFYFSMATLTTVGFGDFSAREWARQDAGSRRGFDGTLTASGGAPESALSSL
jgi:hypothetical protein